jgi:hypothetical protein
VRAVDPAGLAGIDGLIRCEDYSRDALGELITEMTHTVYPHDALYGRFITVAEHIDCPPDEVFAYMADPYSLMEWTYSVRRLRPTSLPDVLVGVDSGDTPIFCKTVADRAAMTVDYHCAWDQGQELWMIYLNRIVPALPVLGQPGSVVIWTNCHHPHYDRNPYPELCRDQSRTWVGQWWPIFPAGHALELANLKKILEHRHHRGLPIPPVLQQETT